MLEPHKPDITYITSFRNVFSIEHAASAVFIAFWLVLPFRGGNNSIWFSSKTYNCIVITNYFSSYKIVLFAKSQPRVYS